MNNAIKVSDVSLSYKNFSLDNISFEIPKGVILGVIGLNGAGKTTLLNCIANHEKDYTGIIALNNNTVFEDEIEFIQTLTYVPDYSLFNNMLKGKKVYEIIKKTFKEFDDEYFNKYLNLFKIDLNKRLDKLSKGMAIKLKLILLMSLKRDVLILDEPTAGIDPVSKSDIINLFQEYIETGERTIVLSTHQTEYLDKIADYILFIDNGVIKMFDYKDDIINKHFLISLKKDLLTDDLKKRLIYYDNKSLSVEALTNDESLVKELKLDYINPNIEDIMIGYLKVAGEKNVY